jgi:hypothetical protein
VRARRDTARSKFRLFQDEQQIGYIDDTTVGFRGFAASADAALAASAAHRGLARRRGKQEQSRDSIEDFLVVDRGPTQFVIARAAVLATLLPPDVEGSPVAGWGFEIELLPEERLDIFATARARVMWRALRSTGIHRRMLQFAAEILPSV